MNQGIHGVDILLHWMGRAESVGAFCRTLAHPIETEDTAVAVVSFAGGAVGTILAATSPLPGYRRRLALYGTEGSVLLEEDCIVRWDLDAPAPDLPSGNQGGHRNPAAISAAGHQRHMEDMVLAVRTGTPVMLDAKEGKRAVELIYSVINGPNGPDHQDLGGIRMAKLALFGGEKLFPKVRLPMRRPLWHRRRMQR